MHEMTCKKSSKFSILYKNWNIFVKFSALYSDYYPLATVIQKNYLIEEFNNFS
jgi:hypothetical protein